MQDSYFAKDVHFTRGSSTMRVTQMVCDIFQRIYITIYKPLTVKGTAAVTHAAQKTILL